MHIAPQECTRHVSCVVNHMWLKEKETRNWKEDEE